MTMYINMDEFCKHIEGEKQLREEFLMCNKFFINFRNMTIEIICYGDMYMW